MNSNDVICPICGTINRNLNLDETDGWMECEKCKTVSKSISEFRKGKKIPVFTPEQLAKAFSVDCQATK